jgi:Flp pilus assembly protein TadG
MKLRSRIQLWPRKRAGAEDGQSLVETAMALFLLTLFIAGVGEFGRVIYASIEISNAAMAGVQYGAQNTLTAADGTGIQNAAQAAAPDLTGLTATSSVGCICSSSGAGTATSSCAGFTCSSGSVEEVVTVNTQASVSPLLHIDGFGLPTSFTLKGQAVQKCTQ